MVEDKNTSTNDLLDESEVNSCADAAAVYAA
jgi:hypothetical protein